MSQNINRLTLAGIVDSQLKATMQEGMAAEYFNPLTIHMEKKCDPMPQIESTGPKTNTTTSVNSIYASVHNKLKYPRKIEALPPLPPPPEEPLAVVGEKKMAEEKPKKTVKRDKQSKPHLHTSPVRARSPQKIGTIPQIKASLAQRVQQRMRRSCGTCNEMSSFNNQQRIKEVLRQKRLLEDMLTQHEKLQRDRLTIAGEIQCMRNYVNDIRIKLDMSLKKLNTQSTFTERHPRTQKKKNKKTNKNPNSSYTLGHSSNVTSSSGQRA